MYNSSTQKCEGGLEALVSEVKGNSRPVVGGILVMLMGLAVLAALLLAVL